ncbi:hypothetical protein ABZ578_38315, partial [Streptomyces sp. NPDC013489]
TEHPRDVDPSITGQPHQATGKVPGLMGTYSRRHPYAGGEGVYAAYLENADGFEVELVAAPEADSGESSGDR